MLRGAGLRREAVGKPLLLPCAAIIVVVSLSIAFDIFNPPLYDLIFHNFGHFSAV
jgi:hypothetical protein